MPEYHLREIEHAIDDKPILGLCFDKGTCFNRMLAEQGSTAEPYPCSMGVDDIPPYRRQLLDDPRGPLA